MLIALLLALGLAWWMHQRGELLPNLQRVLIGGGLALLALRMLETGRIGFAVLVGAGAALWWFGQPRLATQRDGARRAADLAAARALLGVGPDANAATIRTAWRLQIASAHPDAGGDVELATKLTAARDLLLGQLAND
ncbi:molecular chaperone DnaJ [Polymorphobacter arshaanensis]|uniref:Molecular chaperone DnaJ n=1 Tax=Glacieibacterium arshaanense TaxID=2511025 RepID=A0A4Y9ELR2_9SPHN|nr:molecular chaperone DnaJ [Polymorphobacter arshaanensis]TFU02938.1 molecular chaperone DnaJ [Polymorphobacter arshaanensis]